LLAASKASRRTGAGHVGERGLLPFLPAPADTDAADPGVETHRALVVAFPPAIDLHYH
jgi:hypothetical protein